MRMRLKECEWVRMGDWVRMVSKRMRMGENLSKRVRMGENGLVGENCV